MSVDPNCTDRRLLGGGKHGEDDCESDIEGTAVIPILPIISIAAIIVWILGFVVGRRRQRSLLSGTEDGGENKCFLLAADTAGQDQQEPGQNMDKDPTEIQQNLQYVLVHMEGRTDFSTDTLRTLYTSLLSGLVAPNSEDAQDLDLDQIIDTAIRSIDTNGDGIIDVLEMDNIQLPRESGEFLFDDVLACSSYAIFATDSGEACVTVENVVDFLNQFYGGTEVVSPALAQHMRDMSGSDGCYTRAEFEAAFGTAETTLSAAFAAGQTDPSFVMSLALGVGTALYVFGF